MENSLKNQTSFKNPLAQPFTFFSLLRFAAPAIGMMTIISLYTAVDGIFIGRFAGDTALAASNIAYPAINLIFGIAIMLAAGGSSLVAKALGEKQPALAARHFTLIAAAAAGIGFVLALAGFALLAPFLRLLGATPHLLPYCYDYLGALLFFTPFIILKTVFDAFFIADGRPGLGFTISLASGIINALLDWLFLDAWAWGIGGAGLATGIANMLAATAGLLYFASYSRSLRFRAFTFRPRVIGRTALNGMSEMVTQLSVGIITYLFNLITFAWAGENGVASISVIFYMEMLLNSAFLGFTNGIAPVFSYHYGAQNYGMLCRLIRLSLSSIALASLIAFISARLFAAPLIHLFLPADSSTYALTLHGFELFALSFPLCGFNIFAIGFFTAISHARISSFCSFARNLAGISLFLLILPKFWGLNGVWLAVPAADLCMLIFSLFLLHEQFAQFRHTNARIKKNEIPIH
jgi:Na+-driven multidrug efflux pump